MTQDPINVKIWFSEINPNDPVESEIRRIKPKERAERLRTLATIAIILRPFSELIAKSVKRTPDGYIDSRSDNKNDNAFFDKKSFSVNVTVNPLSHPELYFDLNTMPPGYVTARIRMLCETGALIRQISSLAEGVVIKPLNSIEHEEPTTRKKTPNVETRKRERHHKPDCHQQETAVRSETLRSDIEVSEKDNDEEIPHSVERIKTPAPEQEQGVGASQAPERKTGDRNKRKSRINKINMNI